MFLIIITILLSKGKCNRKEAPKRWPKEEKKPLTPCTNLPSQPNQCTAQGLWDYSQKTVWSPTDKDIQKKDFRCYKQKTSFLNTMSFLVFHIQQKIHKGPAFQVALLSFAKPGFLYPKKCIRFFLIIISSFLFWFYFSGRINCVNIWFCGFLVVYLVDYRWSFWIALVNKSIWLLSNWAKQ